MFDAIQTTITNYGLSVLLHKLWLELLLRMHLSLDKGDPNLVVRMLRTHLYLPTCLPTYLPTYLPYLPTSLSLLDFLLWMSFSILGILLADDTRHYLE